MEAELAGIKQDYQEYLTQKLGEEVAVAVAVSPGVLPSHPYPSGWKDFFVKFFTTHPVLLALMVGCGLQMFQQFGGINTVM